MTQNKYKDNGVDIKKNAEMIEDFLKSFGITARVAEVNKNEKDIDFNMEIALGTPLESIMKLHKDIAMAVASPTGDVEIVAPIPGRSLIGIKVPLGKYVDIGETEKYKIIRIQTNTERIIYKGILPQLKLFIINSLILLLRLIERLIDYLSN